MYISGGAFTDRTFHEKLFIWENCMNILLDPSGAKKGYAIRMELEGGHLPFEEYSSRRKLSKNHLEEATSTLCDIILYDLRSHYVEKGKNLRPGLNIQHNLLRTALDANNPATFFMPGINLELLQELWPAVKQKGQLTFPEYAAILWDLGTFGSAAGAKYLGVR